MRETIERTAINSLPAWQRTNPRLKQLALWDMYLDGKIYDKLPFDFYKDTNGQDQQINFYRRKPTAKFNLAKLAATSIARKLFAGRHAPSLVLEENVEALKKIRAYLASSDLDQQMINLVTRGSVGSVCALFRIVITDDGPAVVVDVEKAIDCFPRFDAAKQLKELRVIKQVSGTWFIEHGIFNDSKGEKLDPKKEYWQIKKIDREQEVHFYPIRSAAWNPYSDKEGLVKEIPDGDLGPVEHELRMVPAHWFMNLSTGVFPDGGCLFDPALDNIVTYDYQMSQLWLGLMNGACPITVLSGRLLDYVGEDGKPVPKSSRVIHFESTVKDEDSTEEGGEAYYLESNGQGFAASLNFCRQIKKDAAEQICSSRKDPDKVTTAMSGKGMDLVEEEFLDLVMELRTSYGQNGYLKLVKKMSKAGIRANHPLLKGVSESDVELLDLSWPDIHEMSPQEQQLFAQSLEQGQEAGLIDQRQAVDIYRGKMDVHNSGRLPVKGRSRRDNTGRIIGGKATSKLAQKKVKPKSNKTQEKST